MYKASNDELPEQVVNFTDQILMSTITRQHRNPHIHYRRTQLASKQVNYKGPEIWQNLTNNIRTSKKLHIFTKSYKKDLLKQN